MPLHVVRNDITKMKVDAIVNAANETLLGGGGVDGQIHAAAGPGLLEECRKLGGCKTGDAKITGAYNLPCKYVIHTVGPVYIDGTRGEAELLKSCYTRCLEIATEYKLKSIAFPLISAGAYNFPVTDAFWIAINTVSEFLLGSEIDVYIVVFNNEVLAISNKLYADIEEYIDNNYVENIISLPNYNRNNPETGSQVNRNNPKTGPQARGRFRNLPPSDNGYRVAMVTVNNYRPVENNDRPIYGEHIKTSNLEDELKDAGESFSEMLLRIIDERDLKDSEVYKKANIDRKLFSKIRSNANYKPSKPTVIAFAIALELNLTATEEMLKKAGFAFSHSDKFDIIVEFFIKNKNYNLFELNEALYLFKQQLIGSL